MRRTPEEREGRIIRRMWKLICKDAEQRARNIGGYPDDVEILDDGGIALATVEDDGAPKLVLHSRKKVLLWYTLVKEFLADNPDFRRTDALWETVCEAERLMRSDSVDF